MQSNLMRDLAMPANYPVVRSGLVIESNLDLTESQALRGVEFLDDWCPQFEAAIKQALTDCAAADINVLPAKPVKKAHDDLPGRGIRFREVVFSLGAFIMEARAGVTICEGPRRSKIAVRLLCLKSDGKPPLGLPIEDVTEFFCLSEDVIEKLTVATRKTYTDALEEFVEKNDDIETVGDGPLNIEAKIGFSMRAYDSTDDNIFEMIDDLNNGEPLPDILEQPEYRRLFEELWSVAHYQPQGGDLIAVTDAIEMLRRDDRTGLTIVEEPFVDKENRDRFEQRALVISRIVKKENGVPRLNLTGVMCQPSDVRIYAEEERTSAAFRISGHLVANYAGQF